MSEPPPWTGECPACGAPVALSVPRSATDITILADPAPDREEAVEEDERHRRVTLVCGEGHAVHVYFRW